jgi:hypothetical protein
MKSNKRGRLRFLPLQNQLEPSDVETEGWWTVLWLIERSCGQLVELQGYPTTPMETRMSFQWPVTDDGLILGALDIAMRQSTPTTKSEPRWNPSPGLHVPGSPIIHCAPQACLNISDPSDLEGRRPAESSSSYWFCNCLTDTT